MIVKTYERISLKILSGQVEKPKPFGYFENGKFTTGTKSLHRTSVSRMWRTFLRMKRPR